MRRSNVEEVSFHHLTWRSLFKIGYYGFLGLSVPFAAIVFLVGVGGLFISGKTTASLGTMFFGLAYAIWAPAVFGMLLIVGASIARIITRRFGWGVLEFYEDSDA
jgi:hypothetical protein